MTPADLQKGLVRILTDGGEARRVVGAGFLVSSRHILTCAHVVADALGIAEDAPAAPTTPVWLDWPLVVGSAPMSVKVVCWHPVKAEAKRGELEDIAVLELDGKRPLPDAAQPVPVVVVEDQALFDRPVRMYGFAEDRGDWVNGQLQGPVATGWVQLDHELGRLCVAPGFSGTAVWDKRENAAVGMIVSIASRENVRSAYMIPAASLIRAWPALDEYSRPPNPYRGLEAFREQDARYFMGRDRDIQDVLAMLQQRPFVAVVGASGSGKSSLLFAGVVPQLRKQEDWLIADFRPRGDPFRELATALTLLLYPALDELERLEKRKQLADKLNERSLNLVDVVDLLLKKNPGKRLLLIADQFEELYTQNLAPERQRQFVDELAAAVRTQAKKPAFTLLLALRVDFLGQALDYEPLAEWIKLNHLLLGPLGQAGLEAAIESPARQLGVKLEEGLAERILQDLGQEPGTLPLLEFALTQLWERQQHQRLTHAVYDDIGGVKKALARHADTTLDLLQNEQEQRLRRVFVQLVRPGEGTVDTRQVATREQVGMDNWNLVTELADARLVVTGRDAQGQETVEVVHEALLTHWQKLQGWMKQDRRFRAWQNRLRLDLQEWQKQDRDDGALLRGARLAEAEERLNDHADILSQGEKEYIKASIALRERGRRGRRWVIAGLTAGLLVG
jgi:KaiC/GvpD/RAD55 family RecA-like ATPase